MSFRGEARDVELTPQKLVINANAYNTLPTAQNRDGVLHKNLGASLYRFKAAGVYSGWTRLRDGSG